MTTASDQISVTQQPVKVGYTSGPWHIGEDNPHLIYGSHNYVVADVTVYHSKNDQQANARLIAAAPALYEAALAYRQEEQNDTPRMWRGKKLQDLADALDAALALAGGAK